MVVPASRLVPPGDSLPLDVEDYAWSSDGTRLLVFTNSRRVWREHTRGDYWVLDLATWKLRKLGGDAQPATLMFAKFSPDGRRAGYVREHNLYVEDLTTGRRTQLTSDGSRTTINGTFDWVYEEELSLRDGWRWSPDGRQIAFWQLDASPVRDFDLIDDTDSLYPYVIPVQYPTAGQPNSTARIGVVSAAGGPSRWLDVAGDSRSYYLVRMDWAGNSDEIVLQRLNRRQDTDDLLLGDARSGQVQTILTERDSLGLDVVGDLQWFDHGREFTWVSDRDAWRHLYMISRDGRSVRLLTPGPFDLTHPDFAQGERLLVGSDERAGWLYFTASPDNPSQLYLYRHRMDGRGRPERVTPASQPGTHEYQVAPDGRWAFHTYSSFGTPPITDLVELPSHRVLRTLSDDSALRARVAALDRPPVRFFRVDIGGGVQLDGWMLRPAGFDSTRRYPVLFYVYGDPWVQTVVDSWGGKVDYLWHLMLAQQGYLVVTIDNRGTPAPRGRAWRKAAFGRLGVLASEEQAAAARSVVHWPYVDSTRVGVWGRSSGGSNALNLLFRSPELYRMGIAVSPVTDWRLYDTIYTERWLGLPEENEERYRLAAPITFADHLRGDLLLIHGSGDDNAHYQTTERLVNALVAANKPFTMMTYPNRTHCLCEGPETRLHLFTLITRFLHEHLPAGPAAR